VAVTEESDRPASRLARPERVVALSDGVFAIVMTILVLEIAVPDGLSEQSLRQVVDELRPTLVAWVVSFLITGMFWVEHRDLFSRVRTVNRDLVWLNLLFLLPVSLIPFAASVLGKYPDDPIGLHIYGIVMILATVLRTVLYGYVIRRPALLWPDSNPQRPMFALAVSASPIVVYALAMVVADASAPLSALLYFSVPGLYFLLVTVLRDRAGTRPEADQFT
jgi:uncharacterized membrane protein